VLPYQGSNLIATDLARRGSPRQIVGGVVIQDQVETIDLQENVRRAQSDSLVAVDKSMVLA
jgi:hypothetical protein